MRKMSDIIGLIKDKKSLKTDTDVANLLGLEPDTLHMQKKRDKIPLQQLVGFCEAEGLSLDWLLLGDGSSSRSNVSVDLALAFANDNEMQMIYQHLIENPTDKKAVCDLIRAKLAATEAAERFMKGK